MGRVTTMASSSCPEAPNDTATLTQGRYTWCCRETVRLGNLHLTVEFADVVDCRGAFCSNYKLSNEWSQSCRAPQRRPVDAPLRRRCTLLERRRRCGK